jgi:glycosyltransferase involved in cell wall biosynthesis
MRLAILHYTKPPIVGGVERVIRDLAQALCKRGHEVEVMDRADWRDLGGADGFQKQDPFDAVLVHNVFTMPFDLEWTRELTALAAAMSQVRWVNWVHDVAAVNPAYAELGWNEPVPKVRHVAVSELRAREWAQVAGLEEDVVTVLPNGLDPAKVLGLTARVEELAERHGWWEVDLLLVQPVRLVRRKNVELAIDLIAQLRRNGVAAALVVTGAPDPHQGDGRRYFEALKVQVASFGVADAVTFPGEQGTLSDADVQSLYRLGDALFFPSHSEGFGLPLLEAALHRLPIWCSDLSVHREVIGEEAQFFDLRTPVQDLAERMMAWMAGASAKSARKRSAQAHSWAVLCKERLEPLLTAGM